MKDFHSFLKTAQVSWSRAARVPRRRRGRNWSGDFRFGFVECRSLESAIAIERLRIRSSKRQLSSLHILKTQDFPIEEGTETFRTITLVDSLTSCFLGELEHLIGQLIDTFVDGFHASVHDVDTVVVGMFDEFFHVTSEAGKIGGD